MPSISCRHEISAEVALTLLRWANTIPRWVGWSPGHHGRHGGPGEELEPGLLESVYWALCRPIPSSLTCQRIVAFFFFFWYGVAWAVWIFWRLIHLLGNENKNKNEQWDVIKFKSFCKAKETISKKTTQEYGEIFANKGKLDLTLSFLTYKVCKFKKKELLLYEL